MPAVLLLVFGLMLLPLLPDQLPLKDAREEAEVAHAAKNFWRNKNQWFRGAIIRGDTSRRQIALVFTGDEAADGGETIRQTLKTHGVKASFFLTGRFYRNQAFAPIIQQLKADGHYLGAHSDDHLLYCDWTKRDSLLISKETFRQDLSRNYAEMKRFGVQKKDARYFLPPYEWYNDTIAAWTKAENLQLINYTPGTLSHADYTTPEARNYRPSRVILQSIYEYENRRGLNGFLLLMHIGTDPRRTDKLYSHLDELLLYLEKKNYRLRRVDELL
ncbi:polysaccharide deacetylase family protein [Tellurirhabdus rosea]|uniref:polysaccharide deacetylase family protein n=1 Tax=Tellurirhabdus rosea TaxID=2674997 RepID=UPI002259C307|nr:polysaccharide deacetylase family protein [Tellurirhabdus rosea]